MSNGVGLVAALAGSLPRIAGPRPPEAPPEASRAPGRPPEAPAPPRHPVRTPEAGLLSRSRPELPGPTCRPLRAVSLPGSPRADPVSGAKPPPLGDAVRQLAQALPPGPLRDALRVRMTLSPAHLGDLWIEVSAAGSRLRGKVRAGTAAARDLILAHLDEFRRDLEERGIRFSRLDVEVREAPREDARAALEAGPRSHRRQVLDLRA